MAQDPSDLNNELQAALDDLQQNIELVTQALNDFNPNDTAARIETALSGLRDEVSALATAGVTNLGARWKTPNPPCSR